MRVRCLKWVMSGGKYAAPTQCFNEMKFGRKSLERVSWKGIVVNITKSEWFEVVLLVCAKVFRDLMGQSGQPQGVHNSKCFGESPSKLSTSSLSVGGQELERCSVLCITMEFMRSFLHIFLDDWSEFLHGIMFFCFVMSFCFFCSNIGIFYHFARTIFCSIRNMSVSFWFLSSIRYKLAIHRLSKVERFQMRRRLSAESWCQRERASISESKKMWRGSLILIMPVESAFKLTKFRIM